MATPPTLFGRYELRSELGRGGFATVYRAWDPALQREVALKALHPHLAQELDLRHRFLAEARALARLQHAHIVAVHDVGEAAGRPFFTMALVAGQTLAQILAERQRLALPDVVRLLADLTSALDALHHHGLVHRDLKPQNVMLDQAGRLVLMDLGVARVLGSTTLTRPGLTLGTPAYMAPEQVLGTPVGPAADIYALGVLTYHWLAGRPPFLGDTPAVLYAQAYAPPPPLRDLQPKLPESVYRAIESALAKDPSRRPSSAKQFLDLLVSSDRTLVLPGPHARPAALHERTRKPAAARNHQARVPALVVSVMLAALVVCAAAGVLLVTRHAAPRTQPRTPSPAAGSRASALASSSTPGIAGGPGLTATPQGSVTTTPSATAAVPAIAQAGWTVVLADNFSNPSQAILPTSSDDPAHYQRGYVGGEYRIAIVDPKWDSAPLVHPSGLYANVLVSTDARLVGGPGTGQEQVGVACRRQSGDSHYRLAVDPWSEQAWLIRDDGPTPTNLLFFDGPGVIHHGNAANHLDLQCVGDTIAGFVNGRQIGSVRDQTYSTGEVGLVVDWDPSTDDQPDARFSNLVLYRVGSP